MPRKTSSHYRLTTDLVAAHAGASGIVCLDASAYGRAQHLHTTKPDASHNRRAVDVLADLRGDYGSPMPTVAVKPDAPSSVDVLLVSLKGAIEAESGYHDPCGGWTPGHDSIYQSLAAAFEIGDVVLCIDSPGGAVEGGPEMMRRAAEMKRKHGRRCIGHTERMCGSMALWWAAAICDEMYTSADGRVGSVGARGMLMSIAGALAQDGVTVEILEDPEGKAAGVMERPLDPEAIARAQRDVSIAADMFRAAVCAGSWGRAAGLTPDYLRSTRGDAYVGQAAVDAGFANGVMTLEGVMEYALATAGTGATMDDDEKKPEGEGAPEPENEAVACARCSLALDPKDAFCSKCGTATVPAATAEDEEGPPSSERKPKEEGRAARAPIAPAARTGSTVATMLGLRADASHPAIMTALTDAMRVVDVGAALTGKRSPGEIIGGLHALAHDAAQTAQTQRDLRAAQKKADASERLSLAKRAATVEGKRDGYVDDVIVDGQRVGVKPGPLVAHMPLTELRGYVEGREKNAGPARKPHPFTPDTTKGAQGNGSAPNVTDEDRRMAAQHGGDPAQYARTRSALASRGATGGAS